MFGHIEIILFLMNTKQYIRIKLETTYRWKSIPSKFDVNSKGYQVFTFKDPYCYDY